MNNKSTGNSTPTHDIKINNINVSLEFSDKPNNDTPDLILGILVDSYESRMVTKIK